VCRRLSRVEASTCTWPLRSAISALRAPTDSPLGKVGLKGHCAVCESRPSRGTKHWHPSYAQLIWSSAIRERRKRDGCFKSCYVIGELHVGHLSVPLSCANHARIHTSHAGCSSHLDEHIGLSRTPWQIGQMKSSSTSARKRSWLKRDDGVVISPTPNTAQQSAL